MFEREKEALVARTATSEFDELETWYLIGQPYTHSTVSGFRFDACPHSTRFRTLFGAEASRARTYRWSDDAN